MESTNRTYYQRALRMLQRVVWPILRQVLGWMFIVLGLLGLVLPVLQGVLFLVIGVALVGRRNWLIRRSTLVFKRALRRWAAHRSRPISWAGRLALHAQWKCSRESRLLHRRYAAWSQQRALRRLPPTDQPSDSPDARYDHMSERV